jgi:polyhydroxybutyrate depolymerase
MRRACAILALLLLVGKSTSAADNLPRMEWKVDGVAREALVYAPATAKTAPSPVVFAFHGHGGTMKFAATKFACHEHWPEAIVVYMQGLKTPGTLTDPQGKLPGWQKTFGDQGDRDLNFFDAVLATLKKNIHAGGHMMPGDVPPVIVKFFQENPKP